MSQITKELIYEMYLKLLHLNEQKADSVSQIFLQHITDEEDKLKLLPKNMTSIHVIECIGHNEPINNTTIAKKMNLSKANITKISTKLLKEGLIKRCQLTGNKKEIYFRLTPKGKQVFELHEKLHEMKKEQFHHFIDTFTDEEQKVILKFLESLTIRLMEEQKETNSATHL
ncbi:MarR family transcriptional regulator [Thermaerobacillus caldiproteolyticus]|uniref:MarR family transcriptional regulator n=1 Tax=Thermaerobacillus caldiproteolyticus TaxID=247480 RepID=UPI00188D81F1|nr:MarR family transcriptional regulator [Anoxybacillus caldiproteolyticus]QPA31679.1 MarR family transcriptional regulator [Anoxybacillus caldiproteolyticus]